MSYLALYRKYRPSSFDDLVGQSEIASIIKNEIINNRISHAYLFSGPRGTGKTSTAKIIAKMINCSNLKSDGIPCGECESCLNLNSSSDVVEIDAASNNGVDEIRELRDKVNLVPTYGKYKIYIIDEVHMLTTQAFNALLKTLEEPPAHVIFILATTEFHKIPVTVVSRCQKFQFLKFTNDDIVNKLTEIAQKESILADNNVLYEIARLSDGGMRDAINMLDQLSSFKNEDLNVDDVYKLNGVISYVELTDLLKKIYHNDVVSIISFVDNLDRTGKSFDRFIEDLINLLKDVLIYKNVSDFFSNIKEKNDCLVELSNIFSGQEIYNFILNFNELTSKIKLSSFGKILLVTEFIKISNSFIKKDNEKFYKLNEKVDDKKHDSLLSNDKIVNVLKESDKEINKKLTNKTINDKLKKIRINNAFSTASKTYKENFLANWNLVQEHLNQDVTYISIAGMMSDVEVMVVGEKNVIFLAQYDSLLDRLFEQIDLIEQLLFDVFKVKYKVVFLVKDEWLFEKNKYVSSIKSGNHYSYIEEDCDNEELSDDEDINKLVSILGNEVISYK